MVLTFNSLQEAIDYVRDNAEKGCLCPCCGKKQKVYYQHLTKEMVKGLMHLMDSYTITEEFHLVKFFQKLNLDYIPSAADASIYKLTLWNLLESSGDKGYYRYTQKAVDFIKNGAMIPKFIKTLDNKIIGESKDLSTLKGALKEDFDYGKLMGLNI